MGRPTSRVARVRVAGPLAPFANAYKTRLQQHGYTPLTTVNQLRQVAALSRWLEDAGLTVTDLDDRRIQEFLDQRRQQHGSANSSRLGLVTLVEILHEAKELPTGNSDAVPPSWSETLLGSFHTYLLTERCLARCTADAYVRYAGRFLAECPSGGLSALTAADVIIAVRREAERVSVGSTQYFLAGLRSLLRFCFIEGLAEADLSAAALSITGRRRTMLPRGISQADAAALVRSCDRRRSDGRRDYAVLLILIRLGLRASEVASLTLDDIDWRAGEMVVHGKGGRQDRLPVPADVGEAIAGYLKRGRPWTTRRELFLRSLAPIGPLGRGGVSCIVRRACRRAGLVPLGAHRLRHTIACEMVAAGVGLPDIAQVLRQSSISSTAVYARVDLQAMRALAQPWPGGWER